MKVFVISCVSHATGAFSRQCELVRGLIAAGAEVCWLGPTVRTPIPGVQYVEVAEIGGTVRIGRLLTCARDWLRKEGARIDVSVAFGEFDVAIFASWARRFGRPLVFFSRGDTVANEFLNLAGRRGLRKCFGWSKIAFLVGLRRAVVRRCTAVVVQTPQLAWQMRFIDPAMEQRLLVLPNNSNPSWTRPELRGSWLTTPRGPDRVVGYVGRVSPNRGLEELIRAVRNIEPEARPRLAIFGSEINAGLQGLENAMGVRLDPETLKGVSGRVQEEMRRLDVLVANRLVEACPNVVLEAMAVGVPIVANDLPPYRFLIGNGGVFCQPRDESGLGRALRQLLADRDACAAYSRYLLERARLFEFDWASAASGVVLAAVRRQPVEMSEDVRRVLRSAGAF